MWAFLQVVATALKDHVPQLHISFIVFCHSEGCFNLKPYYHFNLRVCFNWLLCTKSTVSNAHCLTVKQTGGAWRWEPGSAPCSFLTCAFSACHHHLQICSNSWCVVSATHCMPDAGEASEANHISGCSLVFLLTQSRCYHRMHAAKIWESNQSSYRRARGMLHFALDSISPPTTVQHFSIFC